MPRCLAKLSNISRFVLLVVNPCALTHFASGAENLRPANSFVLINKKPGGGDFRLANHWKDYGDLDYRYEITTREGKLFLSIFQRDWEHTRKNNYNNRTIKYKNIHNDFIDELEKKYPCDWGDDATA